MCMCTLYERLREINGQLEVNVEHWTLLDKMGIVVRCGVEAPFYDFIMEIIVFSVLTV